MDWPLAFKICKNALQARVLPGPRWGTHDAPADPLVGWEGDTPPIPHPTQ